MAEIKINLDDIQDMHRTPGMAINNLMEEYKEMLENGDTFRIVQESEGNEPMFVFNITTVEQLERWQGDNFSGKFKP